MQRQAHGGGAAAGRPGLPRAAGAGDPEVVQGRGAAHEEHQHRGHHPHLQQHGLGLRLTIEKIELVLELVR